LHKNTRQKRTGEQKKLAVVQPKGEKNRKRSKGPKNKSRMPRYSNTEKKRGEASNPTPKKGDPSRKKAILNVFRRKVGGRKKNNPIIGRQSKSLPHTQ